MLKRNILCVASVLMVTVVLPGCRTNRHEADLIAAYELGRENRWAEARAHARRYLLHNPEQAAGHYVWGQCNAHPDPQFAIAEGEFTMAQSLLARDNDLGPLEGLLTHDEFASALYRELAVLNMRWGYEAMGRGYPEIAVRDKFFQALKNAETALALNPESKYLGELVEMLRDVPAMLGRSG